MNNITKTIIAAFTVFVLTFISACSGSDNNENEDSTDTEELPYSDSISVEEAETRVRELVLLEEQKIQSTILVNSEEALASLQNIAPPEIVSSIEVGDFFIIFENTQLIYRPSADRIIQTIPIIRADLETELEITE